MLAARDNQILLVDDDKALLELYSDVLTEANHCHVVSASSGVEALYKLRTFSPDILLINYTMPGMDGTETLKHIRQMPNLLHTPVIFITSKADKRDMLRGYDQAVHDVLLKPLPSSTLIITINNILNCSTPTGFQALDMKQSDLRVTFASQSKSCLPMLEELLSGIDSNQTLTNLVSDELYNAVHKIAGTASIFGYPALTPLADRLEIYFDELNYDMPSSDQIKNDIHAATMKLVNAIQTM